MSPAAIAITPISITMRGPRRSISRPTSGLSSAETKKPKENTPAVTPRSQPDSSRTGGNGSENAVRARADADRHGDEAHGDDDPAVEEWKGESQAVAGLGPRRPRRAKYKEGQERQSGQRIRFSGGSPR